MPWFKVDDKFHDHRKARAAGCEAIGFWTMAGSWSSDNLMDGFVPESIAMRWSTRYRKLAAKLVEVGLWEVAEKDGEKGWQFHQWSPTNPLRDKVLAEREAARVRMEKARAKKASSPERSGELPAKFHRSFADPDPSRPDPPRRGVGTAALPDAAEVMRDRKVENPAPMPDELKNRRLKRGIA